MLTEERLKEEIKASKVTITRLEKILNDSISGIEINKLVMQAFKDELKRR